MTVESTEIWNLEEEEKQKNREVKSRGQCNKNRSRVFYVWTYYRVSCNQVYFRSCCIVLIDDANGKFGRSTLLYIGGQKGNLILMGSFNKSPWALFSPTWATLQFLYICY